MGYGFSAFRLFRLHNEFRLRLVAMRILRAGGFSTNSRRQRAMQRQLGPTAQTFLASVRNRMAMDREYDPRPV